MLERATDKDRPVCLSVCLSIALVIHAETIQDIEKLHAVH